MAIFHGYVSLPEGILPEKSEKHVINWGKVLLVDVFEAILYPQSSHFF